MSVRSSLIELRQLARSIVCCDFFCPFEEVASRAVVEKVVEGHVPLRPIVGALGVEESEQLDAMITRKRCVAGDGKENSFASPSQAIDMPFQPNSVPCIVGSSYVLARRAATKTLNPKP